VFTDNSGNCDHSGSILYEGEILTYYNDPIEAVKVSLYKDSDVMYSMTTADNGRYLLVVPQEDGQRYNIVPERLDQPRNGVSTLDLVDIQKHLLGKEFFDHPFKYIAADANNSQQVSAIDLVEIRKLILGIYSEYPNNTSWRFVDKSFQFANVNHPWPFQELINVQYFGESNYGLDFIGVKIGDVNNTVVANATQLLPRNGNRTLFIQASSPETVQAGETVQIELTIPEPVLGFQWTMETKGLTFAGIHSDDIRIEDQHVGVLHGDLLTMSWNTDQFEAYNAGQPVKLLLEFVAESNGNISEMIRMTDRVARAEAYTWNEEIVDVRLEFRNETEATEFALYQNEPNPWNGTTTIHFDLPEEGHVTLSMFDMTGKQVKTIEGEFKAGRNAIQLQKKDLPVQGVLYYRLDSGIYTATKKMIKLD
jgi:hypothetical protein